MVLVYTGIKRTSSGAYYTTEQVRHAAVSLLGWPMLSTSNVRAGAITRQDIEVVRAFQSEAVSV